MEENLLHEEARRFRAPLGAIFLRKLQTEPKRERNLGGSERWGGFLEQRDKPEFKGEGMSWVRDGGMVTGAGRSVALAQGKECREVSLDTLLESVVMNLH